VFKNSIRDRRQELGLSQTELARLVHVAEPTLSDVELGKRYPWPKLRRALVEALGVPETSLFHGSGEGVTSLPASGRH